MNLNQVFRSVVDFFLIFNYGMFTCHRFIFTHYCFASGYLSYERVSSKSVIIAHYLNFRMLFIYTLSSYLKRNCSCHKNYLSAVSQGFSKEMLS